MVFDKIAKIYVFMPSISQTKPKISFYNYFLLSGKLFFVSFSRQKTLLYSLLLCSFSHSQVILKLCILRFVKCDGLFILDVYANDFFQDKHSRSFYCFQAITVNATLKCGSKRANYDGFAMFFLSMLDPPSAKVMDKLIERHLLNVILMILRTSMN